jgi:hypothetical protein
MSVQCMHVPSYLNRYHSYNFRLHLERERDIHTYIYYHRELPLPAIRPSMIIILIMTTSRLSFPENHAPDSRVNFSQGDTIQESFFQVGSRDHGNVTLDETSRTRHRDHHEGLKKGNDREQNRLIFARARGE